MLILSETGNIAF